MAQRLRLRQTMSTADRHPPCAVDALQRLRDGNRRFVQNVRSVDSLLGQAARRSLVAAQAPIVIVLSCSDSRAPAELVFDQGRVARSRAEPSEGISRSSRTIWTKSFGFSRWM